MPMREIKIKIFKRIQINEGYDISFEDEFVKEDITKEQVLRFIRNKVVDTLESFD